MDDDEGFDEDRYSGPGGDKGGKLSDKPAAADDEEDDEPAAAPR